MKAKIHPDYHEINVVMTDGSKFTTRSTYGKPGDTLHLDIDPKSHPAWTGVHRLMDSGGQLRKVNRAVTGHANKEKVTTPTSAAEPEGRPIGRPFSFGDAWFDCKLTNTGA